MLIERFPHDNLAALGSPSKSGHTLSRGTVQSYLKTAGYLRFKARRNPFLTHKNIRRLGYVGPGNTPWKIEGGTFTHDLARAITGP